MILITGASGLIGRAIAGHYLDTGARLRLQVRNRRRFLSALEPDRRAAVLEGSAQVVEADFSTGLSGMSCRDLVAGCSAVIHAAACVHRKEAGWSEYELVNVKTTEELARAALAASVESFLFLSTSAVYGPGPFVLALEETPVAPLSPYAHSKAISEKLLFGLLDLPRVIILRLALVFGEGDRGNMLALIQRIHKRRYLHVGGGAACKSLVCARDVAQAVALCLEQLPEGRHVFNVANLEPCRLKDLAETIKENLGINGSIPAVPESLMRLGTRLAEIILRKDAPITVSQLKTLTTTTTVSCQKLVDATGFQPCLSLADALAGEIAWARSCGILH